MFSWCQSCQTQPSGSGYLVQKQTQPPRFYPNFTDIKEAELQDPATSVLKVNKSDYDSLTNTLNGKDRKFVDVDFSPQEKSMGSFEGIAADKWKRITDIVEKPLLFPKEIHPADALKSGKAYQGYQAALSAMSERPERLKSIFGSQTYNPKGIYTLLLRYRGKIEEVVIDDYVPVGQDGQPLFARPTDGAIWNVLIEKARAKLHGSYENMVKASSSPRTPLQELTFAPTDLVKSTSNKDDIWHKIVEGTKRGAPVIGRTSNSQKTNWISINLTPAHYYTILDAGELPHKLGSVFRVIKLRNPATDQEYKGEGSLADTLFWDQIENSEAKSRLLSHCGTKQGINFMLFSDYLKYYEETFVSQAEETHNYLSEPLKFLSSNGLVYDLRVLRESSYSISLDQDVLLPRQNDLNYTEDGYGRSTILVIRDNSNKIITDYEYVSGLLRYNDQHTSLKVNLTPGKYVLYAKIDPTVKHANFPKEAHLAVYAQQSVILKESSQQKYPDLLKKVFLSYGRANKRQFYNNDLMWSSWKLIAQGGYAYIAFGNNADSKSKFVIKFSQETFLKQNFLLKKPYKGKGEQTIEVLPGKEEVILLRIRNSEIKQVNFPPPIDLQILAL